MIEYNDAAHWLLIFPSPSTMEMMTGKLLRSSMSVVSRLTKSSMTASTSTKSRSIPARLRTVCEEWKSGQERRDERTVSILSCGLLCRMAAIRDQYRFSLRTSRLMRVDWLKWSL